MATLERVARSAQAGGWLALASAMLSFAILLEWQGAATTFRVSFTAALLLTALSGSAGMAARFALRRRAISDPSRRAALHATALACIAAGLLLLLAVAVPSNRNAVRQLRTTTSATPPERASTP